MTTSVRDVALPCAGMRLDQALTVLAAMERADVRYVLVGSMAMAANGLVRATRDIDFMVDDDPENVRRLREALRQVFDDPDLDQLEADDLAGSYPVVQYFPPGEDYSIDLIARLGQAFSYDDIEWDWLEVEGLRIRVATPRMLWRMKRDTVRGQDRIDAQMLAERFDVGDDG